ncbi:hypothetical protein, partial [Micromonospora echinospora]
MAEALPPEYRPVAGPAVDVQANALGIDPDLVRYSTGNMRRISMYSNASVIAGEVYVKGGELYGFLVRKPGDYALQEQSGISNVSVGYVGYSLDGAPATEEFERVISTAFNTKLEEIEKTSERTRAFLNEQRTHADAPSEVEVAAADVLKDAAARTLMQAIKAAGGLLVSDLAKQIQAGARSRIDDIQEKLIATSLLEQEIVVVCSKSRTPILSACLRWGWLGPGEGPAGLPACWLAVGDAAG